MKVSVGRLKLAGVCAFVSSLCLSAGVAQATPGYTVTDLGALNSNLSNVEPISVGNNGQVAASSWALGYGYEATAAGVTQTLYDTDLYGDSWTGSTNGTGFHGVSNDGTIVGTDAIATPTAAIWSPGSYTSADTLILPSGASKSYGEAISSTGEVVGTYYDASSNPHAFSWTNGGGVVQLAASSWTLQTTVDVDANGDIIGTGVLGGNSENFLLTHTGNIYDLGSTATNTVMGVNNSGYVVGAIGSQGAIWNPANYGTPTLINPLTGDAALELTGINSSGTIIGISTASSRVGEGIVMTTADTSLTAALNELNNLDGGFAQSIVTPTDINDSGVIAALAGAKPWYAGDGVLLTPPEAPPVPEPISMIFFGTGLVAVGGYLRRRKMSAGN